MAAIATSATTFPLEWCRAQFPALSRQVDGQRAVYFDGPAGSQVPQRVADAVSHYLTHTNANHGGQFATSRESDAMLEAAHLAVAELLGVSSPEATIFGANMTSLTFAFSRALARTWHAGDEIIVTRLDHDANVTPWVLAARDAGATVHHVGIRAADCTLDLDALQALLSPRTRLVAVGAASNAVGTINPLADICHWVHDVGGQVFVDAVHYAPHELVDAAGWDCDYVACSAYKFFGPHVGILWGRPELLAALAPYKVRPAADLLPERWMTGTQNHEGIAGVLAAIDYLADLGRHAGSPSTDRREALIHAFAEIGAYERQLCARLLEGLSQLASVRVWGIAEPSRLSERVPTVSITHRKLAPRELADYLASRGIFAWHGNFYALPLTEALELEPDGLVRLGILHYNTQDEVERLLAVLRELEQQPIMSVRPTQLELRGDDRLLIAWSDGVNREITFRELRSSCPCATCRERRAKPPEPAGLGSLPVLSLAEAQPLRIVGMKPVGHYAYSITFSDGHDTGIFTLEFLRELGKEVPQ